MDAVELPTAIDVSSVVGLVAVGMFTAQILLGLLLSVGYNPIRHWPRQGWIKLFTFHNWVAYAADSEHARRNRFLPDRVRRDHVVCSTSLRTAPLEAASLHGVRRGRRV